MEANKGTFYGAFFPFDALPKQGPPCLPRFFFEQKEKIISNKRKLPSSIGRENSVWGFQPCAAYALSRAKVPREPLGGPRSLPLAKPFCGNKRQHHPHPEPPRYRIGGVGVSKTIFFLFRYVLFYVFSIPRAWKCAHAWFPLFPRIKSHTRIKSLQVFWLKKSFKRKKKYIDICEIITTTAIMRKQINI